jgi:hypothetical protein
MMYVVIVLLMFVAAIVLANAFLSWLLVEPPEDETVPEREAREAREARSFYRPRTWRALRRLLAKRPPLLTYRRDKNGRFRKLQHGSSRPPSRNARARKPRSSGSANRRGRVQIPAE